MSGLEKNIDIVGLGVPERLREFRHAKNLSKSDLAERSGLSFRTIHDLERGRRSRVLEKTLSLLADALGVTYDELLHGKPDPAPDSLPSIPVPDTLQTRSRRPVWWAAVGVLLAAVAVTLQPWEWGGESSAVGVPLVTATSSSSDALRHYALGVKALDEIQRADAIAYFNKALEYDSTFAMAYVRLSNPLILDSVPYGLAKVESAERYWDEVTDVERAYIRSRRQYLERDIHSAIAVLERLVTDQPDERDAHKLIGYYSDQIGDYEEAIRHYRAALKIHPDDSSAYNRLAYAYEAVGDIENALWSVNHYIELAEYEANPYDTKGDLLARNGRPEEALESYEHAIQLRSDFFPSIQSLGSVNLLLRNYTKSESYFRHLTLTYNDGARARGRFLLATIPMYRGDLDGALETLDQCIAGDKLEGPVSDEHCHKFRMKADVYAARGEMDEAVNMSWKAVEAWRDIHTASVVEWFDDHVRFLARAGRLDEAAAFLDSLEASLPENSNTQIYCYWSAKGWLEFESGDSESAAVSFERANDQLNSFLHAYPLAVSLLRAGRADESVTIFGQQLADYTIHRVCYPLEAVQMYYYAGIANEESGNTKKAVELYEEFIEIWADADPAFDDMIRDAVTRLETLNRSNEI